MSFFKRISATISSNVDQMVSQIENHDAVVEAAIRDARRSVAQSRVRLARLKSDNAELGRRYADLRVAEDRWAERAKAVAEHDEDKAIECLRRRKDCQRQITDVSQAREKMHVLEDRLNRDIRQAEQKITQLSQQRQMMRTRQSTAEALNQVSRIDESVISDLADTFERWEVNITEAEINAGTLDTYQEDSLEMEFIDDEEKALLRAELDVMISNKENSND